ncbi:rifampicin phosphotransferase-like isoform X2 [Amblyomma americanum]
MCLATLAVVFMGGLLWLRWPLLSSPLLQLRRFWTPGPGGPVVWCKWLLLRLLVPLCRRRGRFDLYSFGVPYDPRRCGLLSPEEEASLDDVCAPADKDSRWSHDEQLLWSSTESGECVVARVRRQPSGSAQAWLYVRTADGHCYVLPPEQRLYADESLGGGHYSAGGLRMERLVPMRRWRIAFNGLLRCTTRGDALVHVQIGLVCKSSSNVFEHQAHFSSNFVARQLTNTSWRKVPNVTRLLDAVDSYVQSVFCTGSISVNGEASRELFLWGLRVRSIENLSQPLRSFGHIMGRTKSGVTFYMRQVGIDGLIERYQTGLVVLPSTELGPVTDCSEGVLTDGRGFKNNFSFDFGPGRNHFHFEVRTDYKPLDEQPLAAECPGAHVTLSWWPCVVNDHPGCLLYLSAPWEPACGHGTPRSESPTASASAVFTEAGVERPEKMILSQTLDDPSCPQVGCAWCPNTLSLDEPRSRLSSVAGGKGASLAALRMIATDAPQIVVPEGFVVTTAAFEKFSRNPDVQSAIHSLSCIASFTEPESIEACCRAVRAVESAPLPEDVASAIRDSYGTIFGHMESGLRVAVRSSAVGEDSEDMSCAGQMDTFLAVNGVDEVIKTVAKCWSSQFTHIACGYKRRYGQRLRSPMAVVVQAMAPAAVAGVLFTCDSRTGDSRRILITANHGLGDSVVSGKADPDTVVLERSTLAAEPKVAEVHVGSKQHRTVILVGGGTELRRDEPTVGCCLSQDQIRRLGRLAVQMESAFGSARDIEWAFGNGTLFVLQPTDVELMHELDDGFRTTHECLTKANIGEVVNGAQSPLGSAIFTNGLMLFNKEDNNERAKRFHNPYHDRFFVTVLGNVFFPASNDIFQMSGKGALRKAVAFAMRGGCMEDDDVERLTHERATLRFAVPRFFSLRKMVSDLWNCEQVVRDGYQKYYHIKLPVEKGDDSRKIFEEICRSLIAMARTVQVHAVANVCSIVFNSLAFTLLAKQRGEWSDEVISDFGSLMTSAGDVWSAEVPSALQEMASQISTHPESKSFKAMDPEDALLWLLNSDAGPAFRQFLDRHGHRCINEFDVYSKTWAMDPTPLVKNLQHSPDPELGDTDLGERRHRRTRGPHLTTGWQRLDRPCGVVFLQRAMAGTVDTYTREPLPIERAVESLDIKLGVVSRKLLTWLMRKCRRGVALRELSKNLVVKVVDAIRCACWLLADQMHREGRLPEPSTLFFLDLAEIDQLLRTRSPRLVAKALRRERLHPLMKKRVFPELVKGIPSVVEDVERRNGLETKTLIKGTPVSGGIAEGPARVVHTIEEAAQIQRGDVLVAYCTDIAWSPFFPLLSGVITELGGLISHGAVVAREYGIPCVVGASGATYVIRPGSMVRLDGTKGTLEEIVAV